MLPEFLPGENLEDPSHPFHEVYRRWNVNHIAELEKPKQCADKKKEENRKDKDDKLEIEGNR